MYSVPGEIGWLREMIKRYLSIQLSIIFYTVLITMVSELLLHVWSLSHFSTELVSRGSKAITIFWRGRACGRTACSVCSGRLAAAGLYRRKIPFISCLGSLVWLLEDAVQMDYVQRVSLGYQHCCSRVHFTSPRERGYLFPASLTAAYQEGDFNSEKTSKDLATLTWIDCSRDSSN